jgi:hypothetical protein
MTNGGARPGAGRPRGAHNGQRARDIREIADRAIANAVSGEMSPIDVMLAMMRGEGGITERQYRAAVDVAPYVCPRLSAIAVQSSTTKTLADLIAEKDRIMAERGLVLLGKAELETDAQSVDYSNKDE